MQKVFCTVRNNVILLFFGIILGLVALLVVHLLPTEPMVKNVRWSMDMIENEFEDETLISGYKSTLTGNFTDCLMLEHAVYSNEEHSILEQVLQMYRRESYYNENDPDGWWPGQSLKDYVYGVSQPREVAYARYWHGYLVILKPLLLFTTVNNIRLINAILQLILVGSVMIELVKKNAYFFSKAFLISLPFMFFVSTFASLSLSVCFYIVHIGILIQCKCGTIERRGMYGEFFFILGMVTAYFDFLTYPLVTLGYPLCVYFYLHGKSMKSDVKKLAVYIAEWLAGYVGLWAAKWVLADLFTDSSTIKDALGTILTRTQSVGNENRFSGFIQVLTKNVDVYLNWGFLLIILSMLGIGIYKICKRKIKVSMRKMSQSAVFFLIALLPFGWYLVTQNHSEQHWQFTCRIIAVTVFAVGAGVAKLCEEGEMQE